MATATPSLTDPPVDYVILNIPTRVPRHCLPPNTSPLPAPAAWADAPQQQPRQDALNQPLESERQLEGKVERRTTKMDGVIDGIIQIVGLYSVFVGVVFTAVVQSERLQCQHIWSPVLLCVFAWLTIMFVTRRSWRRYKLLRIQATMERESGPREELRSVSRFHWSRVIYFVLTALTLMLVGSFIHILCLKEITSRLRGL